MAQVLAPRVLQHFIGRQNVLLIGELRDKVLLLLRRLRICHVGPVACACACDGGCLVQEPRGHMAELHEWGWAGWTGLGLCLWYGDHEGIACLKAAGGERLNASAAEEWRVKNSKGRRSIELRVTDVVSMEEHRITL